MCTFSRGFRLNVLSQRLHWNGFFPRWLAAKWFSRFLNSFIHSLHLSKSWIDSICDCKVSSFKQFILQIGHLYFPSSCSNNLCFLSWFFMANLLSQFSHWYSWTNILCLIKLLFLGNFLSQILQVNFSCPWAKNLCFSRCNFLANVLLQLLHWYSWTNELCLLKLYLLWNLRSQILHWSKLASWKW